MRRLLIVGIGTGDPEQLTLQAINALKSARVIFLTDKGNAAAELREARREICTRYLTPGAFRLVEFADPERDRSSADYRSAVDAWHAKRTDLYEQLILENLSDEECGAFLVWGDPSLYDSILRILPAIAERKTLNLTYDVIPGVSSLQVLAARHRIPLNEIGESFQVTTGRRLAETLAREPGSDNVIVMLDGDCAFATASDPDDEIYWGAYLGMPGEILISGKVRDVTARIREARADARAQRGWIMDTYLLRRRR
jgi:precorrin-6A synthase